MSKDHFRFWSDVRYISQVKQVMQKNIDVVIDRGVELNDLEEKAGT